MADVKKNSGKGTYLTLWATSMASSFKSNVLVLGAVNTAINDQECQHATRRFESIKMLLDKPAGWPTFVQSHPSVKTVD